ncbi:MAG: hypothetical protein R3F49_06730 [Planctomycetota bacterium]
MPRPCCTTLDRPTAARSAATRAAAACLACVVAWCASGSAALRPEPAPPDARDATVTFTLDEAALEAGLDVRVLNPEPPLAKGLERRRSRLARSRAPFVSVRRGAARGEVLVGGVPAGEVVVVVSWSIAPGGAARTGRREERALVWRTIDARAGEVHRLGRLRPSSARTEVVHRLVEEGGLGMAEVSALALRRPTRLDVELIPSVPRGAIAPVVWTTIPLGATLVWHGANVHVLELQREMGPEHLAPGWLFGPSERVTARGAVGFTQRVARAGACAVAIDGVPPGTHEVHLWARRDAPNGAWLTASADAVAEAAAHGGDPGPSFVGELQLGAGEWRVLAQAVDGEGRPTAGTAEVRRDVADLDELRRGIRLTLAPSASLRVRGERSEAESHVAVRPCGWTVDLDAGALGQDGQLRLTGLLGSSPHDLVAGGSSQRVHAARGGGESTAWLR